MDLLPAAHHPACKNGTQSTCFYGTRGHTPTMACRANLLRNSRQACPSQAWRLTLLARVQHWNQLQGQAPRGDARTGSVLSHEATPPPFRILPQGFGTHECKGFAEHSSCVRNCAPDTAQTAAPSLCKTLARCFDTSELNDHHRYYVLTFVW